MTPSKRTAAGILRSLDMQLQSRRLGQRQPCVLMHYNYYKYSAVVDRPNLSGAAQNPRSPRHAFLSGSNDEVDSPSQAVSQAHRSEAVE